MLPVENLARGIIKISGADSFKFLQGLVTNDIKLANNGIYCFLLSSTGKYLFDFFVLEIDSNYIIDVVLSEKNELIAKLHMYKMRSNIIISDLSEDYIVTYSKEQLSDAIFSYQDPRYANMGFRSFQLQRSMFNNEINNLYITDKYNYSIIDGDIDMIQNKSFPIEYGAEQLNAISYTKGCYIGQEVVSRTKYQGIIRKSIMQITFGLKSKSSIKGEIFFQGKEIGRICSFFNCKAIALIRDEGLSEKELTEALVFSGVEVISVVKAPWYSN